LSGGGAADTPRYDSTNTQRLNDDGTDPVSDPITDEDNGTPRTSNETRGKTHIEFDYYKIEAVTPSGETVSAQREVFESGAITTAGGTVTVTHQLGAYAKDLIIKVEARSTTGDYKEIVSTGFSVNGAREYGVQIETGTSTLSSFDIILGDNGLLLLSPVSRAYSYVATAYFRITMIKPNLIATVSDVPDVVEITDAVDVVKTLPNPAEMAGERVYVRKGTGTGKFTLNCPSGVFLDFGDDLLSSVDLEGNGTLIITPSGGNLLVKEYRDSISVGTLGSTAGWSVHKLVDGTMTQDGIVRQSSWDVWTQETFGKAFFDTNSRVQAMTRWENAANLYTKNITATTFDLYQSGSQAIDVSIYATGRWRA
jgi:hypothetical protein